MDDWLVDVELKTRKGLTGISTQIVKRREGVSEVLRYPLVHQREGRKYLSFVFPESWSPEFSVTLACNTVKAFGFEIKGVVAERHRWSST